MINENKKIVFSSHPFPYVKISNFLNPEFFEKLEKSFPKIDDFKNHQRSIKRMDFDTTYGDELYNKLIHENDYYKKFHDYVYSLEFLEYFINLFSNDIKNEYKKGFFLDDINLYEKKSDPFEVNGIIHKSNLKKKNSKFIYPRLDIGLGKENYGKKNGGAGIHIDNPQRLVSILFYVGGYREINGGEHRIWKRDNTYQELEVHETIKPEKNLLIAGLQNNLAFHDVNPVQSINGTRNAFYLAISSSIPIWKDVKSNRFNIKYNKNRVKLKFYQKIIKKIFK